MQPSLVRCDICQPLEEKGNGNVGFVAPLTCRYAAANNVQRMCELLLMAARHRRLGARHWQRVRKAIKALSDPIEVVLTVNRSWVVVGPIQSVGVVKVLPGHHREEREDDSGVAVRHAQQR
jgi:hypothetical protein